MLRLLLLCHVCRFQESTNRLTLKFTAAEGAPGKVTVYIIPALPPKTCPSIEVQLLPLCLHQLVSSPGSVLQQCAGAGLQGDEGAAVLFSQLQLERPFSELVFQGRELGAMTWYGLDLSNL
jgi:hypothetical protein